MSAFPIGVGLIVAGGVAVLVPAGRPRIADFLFRALVGAGALLVLAPAVGVLAGNPPVSVAVSAGLPGGAWTFGIDRLSAWFLLVVAGVGAVIAIYGVGYLDAERAHHRPVALAHAGVALLIASMVGVVTARAVLPFLIAWEVMAVAAYFLILFESERVEVRRGAFLYLILTHAGTLALIAMFLTWSGNRTDLSFASLASASPGLAHHGAAVLLLALVGFGIKAGLVPGHFWLPGAHAVAPSPVSALLSGVMIKAGVYGLFRVIDLIGTPPAWWGWTLLLLGIASGVLGVLWALVQRDLKRTLAYSSVENVGIIALGMGIGVLGLAYGRPVTALLGFTGALLHALNHSLFKSLLFLGAGAVVRAAGTRSLDRLGGLASRLPLTTVCFAAGAIAIAGLPPMNGFVGEWIAVQGLLSAGGSPGILSAATFGLAGLALIAGLAIACFVRIVGVVFLGQPRSEAARTAPGDDPSLVIPTAVLVAACLTIGLAPGTVVEPAVALGSSLARADQAGVAPALAAIDRSLAGPTILGASLLALVALGLLARARRRRVADPPVAGTWGCAYGGPTTRMQYTASSFGASLVASFGPAAVPRTVRSGDRFETDPQDRVLDEFVRPTWRRIEALAGAFRPLQRGRVTLYLGYIVLTVLALLVMLFASVGRGR